MTNDGDGDGDRDGGAGAVPDETSATATETIDARLAELDLAPTGEVVATLLASQRRAASAVERAADALAAAVDAAAARLADGDGRLVLCGAGASGRIAVQDGAELWPTFGWPRERLLLCMAGGERALTDSVEGVEDDAAEARDEAERAGVGSADVVVALAASGRSAWTCAWLVAARERGALTVGLANNAGTPLLDAAEHPLWLDTGPEVLAGSTRMAAGTAQKIAMNAFTTALMIRLNRTYGNLMVDMAAVNAKLDGRRLRMLCTVLPELDESDARAALEAAGGWVKLAAVIAATGDDAAAGRRRLERCGGALREVLGRAPGSDHSWSAPAAG